MNSNNAQGLWAVTIMVVTAVLVLMIVMGYKDCQNTDERVLECVKAGHPPESCYNAFHVHEH